VVINNKKADTEFVSALTEALLIEMIRCLINSLHAYVGTKSHRGYLGYR
jgi:hypothetical protein